MLQVTGLRQAWARQGRTGRRGSRKSAQRRPPRRRGSPTGSAARPRCHPRRASPAASAPRGQAGFENASAKRARTRPAGRRDLESAVLVECADATVTARPPTAEVAQASAACFPLRTALRNAPLRGYTRRLESALARLEGPRTERRRLRASVARSARVCSARACPAHGTASPAWASRCRCVVAVATASSRRSSVALLCDGATTSLHVRRADASLLCQASLTGQRNAACHSRSRIALRALSARSRTCTPEL